MAPEIVPGYLRIRVVNPRVTTLWTDGFENLNTANQTLWHSLGTEAGTDNSINYWTQQAGVWSYASHLVTSPTTANQLMFAGNKDWTDGIFWLRFKWSTGTAPQVIMHCDGTVNNFICVSTSNSAFNLQKVVGGSLTTVATTAATPTNGNFYWAWVSGSGNQYSGALYNDSAGAVGSQIVGISAQTISDAGVQSGYVGIGTSNGTSAATTHGGAFSNVCYFQCNNVIAPFPWTGLTTTGEPAFALSKVSPQAGTYSGSIEFVNSTSGNAALQFATTIPVNPPSTVYQLSTYIKTPSGTANVSAGGLTTPNAPTNSTWTQETVTGSMTANPTISCNYSGAAGRAYFDTMALVSQGQEITSDLPHIGPCSWSIRAFQPGNPSTSALGQFTIPLHPPDTEGYANAKAIYDQLDYFQRVEAYIGPDASAVTLGKMVFSGVIDEISKQRGVKGARFELRGRSDLLLANLSRPFPGEFLSNDVTSAMVKSYMGVNELAWGDTFNPFTAANYVSTALPAGSNGTWTGTTDDGFSVVTTSTGAACALISKIGATCNDRWHTQFVEVTGRATPSADPTRAVQFGIGLSKSSSTGANSILAFVVAQKQNGRYQLVCGIQTYTAGSITAQFSSPSILYNVDDPNGKIPFTIGLLLTNGGNSAGTSTGTLVVNGKVVLGQFATGVDLGTSTTWYPFLEFQTPLTGSASVYFTNFLQFTRFAADGPSTAAAFTPGTVTASTNSLGYGVDPGPSHLEAMQRLATREGFYLRYNPQPYVPGVRTLGTVDYAAAPGTDRSNSIIFSALDGTEAGLGFGGNADGLVSDTATTGQSTLDGGGIGFWRDLATITKYGVLQDESLAFTQSDFNTLRRAAFSISQNKINVGTAGAKTMTVARDAATNEVYRELDSVTVHDPEMGANKLKALIIGLDFTEGAGTEDLMLDQFGLESQLV